MKFISSTLYAFFLGGALSFVGVKFYDWRFYAIMIPAVVFVEFKVAYSRDN